MNVRILFVGGRQLQDTLQTAKPKDCWWLPMGLRGELKKVQVPDINEIARKSKII